MQDGLYAGPESPDAQMGVGVSPEEQHLEEEYAGGPHRGAATEPRQNVLRDQRLSLKEEKGSGEDGQGVWQ